MLRGKIIEKQQQVRNFAEVRNFVWHRVRNGVDNTMKILDWIRITKISDPFKTKAHLCSGNNRKLAPTGLIQANKSHFCVQTICVWQCANCRFL